MFQPKNLSNTISRKLCLGRSPLAPLKKGGFLLAPLFKRDWGGDPRADGAPDYGFLLAPLVKGGWGDRIYSKNRGNWYKYTKSLLIGVVATGAIATEAIAHKVEISSDVGGTIHLEPNDNPQAGKPTLAWIALTRKGGQTIPLQQCDCQLAVYAEPRQKDATPILKPSLKAVSAEKYQGIPGAEIVFPKPGAYQVELKGTPKAGANFKPFQLNFDVTVATGS